MSRSWAKVCLGEALRRSEETIKPYPDTEYREITVRLWGKGVVERGRILGASLNGRRFVAHAGQFIASKIDARNGAMGLIPESLEGALVTNDFPIFNLNKEKLEPRFLGWLCRTADFVELCLRASEGTTNRVRLKEERFLALEIPLPPLEEQQRVVARIEKMAAQIEEARALRKETADEVDALLRSVLDSDKNAQPVPLRDLVKLRSPDVSVRVDENYQFAGVYCFGRGVFKGNLKSGLDFAYPRLTRLRAGEFVYPKLMAWEGAFGVVPKECDGCVVSTEFPVFEVNSDRVFPEVLDTYFCTPSVWPEVAGESTGTNVRRRRLNPQDFLNFKMPLPSRETQLMFMKIRAAMDELKPLQMETASTLDALMPALLDRAFKGEL